MIVHEETSTNSTAPNHWPKTRCDDTPTRCWSDRHLDRAGPVRATAARVGKWCWAGGCRSSPRRQSTITDVRRRMLTGTVLGDRTPMPAATNRSCRGPSGAARHHGHTQSTPHTRALQPHELALPAWPRSIPAYAGATPTPNGAATGAAVDPRVRGRYTHGPWMCFFGFGRSPRTRERRLRGADGRQPRRPIPAYAGTTTCR